jgi:hypothetical protein
MKYSHQKTIYLGKSVGLRNYPHPCIYREFSIFTEHKRIDHFESSLLSFSGVLMEKVLVNINDDLHIQCQIIVWYS